MDVGAVVATLGARLDDDAFDRFDKRLDKARREARDDVEAKLKGDHDDTGFKRFDSRIDKARREAKDDVEAKLKGDHDDTGFKRFDSRIDKARREARDDVEAKLKGGHDDTGFKRFESRLDSARRDAKRDVEAKLGADVDESGFRSYRNEAGGLDNVNSRMTAGSRGVGVALGASAGAAGIAAVAIGGLAFGAYKAVSAFDESEVVARRQALVIRTMGQDAGASAKHVDTLAESLALKTAIDDDTIKAGTNVIRTFRNIRNEAGAGNDMFDRTTKASLDLSVAMGTDLQSASVLLGKAMNDPAKGAMALGRSGTIAKGDLEELKKMAEGGAPILEQQRFVLEKVEEQFKGSAASGATASAKVKTAFGELAEDTGKKLSPTFNKVGNALAKFITGFRQGEGAGGRFRSALARVGGVVGPIAVGIYSVGRSIVDFARRIGGAGDGAGRFGSQVRRIFSAVIDNARRLGSFLKKTFDGIGPDLRDAGRGFVKLLGVIASVVGPIIRSLLPPLRRGIEAIATIVRQVIRVVGALFRGDFATVFKGLGSIVKAGVKLAGAALQAGVTLLGGVALKIGRRVVSGIANTIKAVPGRIVSLLGSAANAVKGLIGRFAGAAADLGRGIVNGIINVIKAAPGAVLNAIKSLIPGPLKKIASKIPGLGSLGKRTGGRVGPNAGGMDIRVAGEGDKDEWIVSQEGDRQQNIGYALDALRALGANVTLHRRGKGAKKSRKPKRAPRPKLSAATNAGIASSVAREETGFRSDESAIQSLEREYDLLNRRADLDPNDFLVEHEDGSVTIDLAAQADRVGEISGLRAKRAQIMARIEAYRRRVTAAIRVYLSGIRTLMAARSAAKGKARAKERSGYTEKIDDYQGRVQELAELGPSLGFDAQDAGIDLEELDAELRAVAGGTQDGQGVRAATPVEAETPDASGPDTGDTTATPGPPDPAEVAAQAIEQVAAFQSARADLFGGGANYLRPDAGGGALAGVGNASAAGSRYFGGASGGAEGGVVTGAGGTRQVNQYITFTGPAPADPHTFTQATMHELKAAT